MITMPLSKKKKWCDSDNSINNDNENIFEMIK